jgi:hypothetical protein
MRSDILASRIDGFMSGGIGELSEGWRHDVAHPLSLP